MRLDEGEFGVFLLTNPRQRLNTGRRLAGVGNGLTKSENNGRFSSYLSPSGKCQMKSIGFLSREE